MPRRPSHRFDDRFGVRVALLAWERIAVPDDERALAPAARIEAARARLRSIADDPLVREAIFLGSPSLAAELDGWRADPSSPRARRAERALVRYVARMATRATPFGVFAGVGVGRISRAREAVTAIEVGDTGAHRRHTRVAHAALRAIARRLERREDAGGLRYRTTTSAARAGGVVRYDESHVRADGSIGHQLVAVAETPAVADALDAAAAGVRRAELAAALAARGHGDAAELGDLVDELIDAQLLRSELATAPPGDAALPSMIGALREADMAEATGALATIAAALEAIDEGGIGAPVGRYRAALRAMAPLLGAAPAPRGRSRFHVEVGARVDAVLTGADADAIASAVDVLVRLTRHPPHRPIQEFRDAFAARWSEEEVPLLHAIDDDAGVGFGTSVRAEEASPLLAGMPLSPAPEAPILAWEGREQWLLGRLAQAIASGARELTIDPAELASATTSRPVRLADAYGVRARVAAGGDILLDEVHGPSGARLLGRFGVDPDLTALVRDHLAGEAALDPGAVHAEIVFAGDALAGDVIARPTLREAEIVHLEPGRAPVQLGLADLLVSVRGDRVVLRSRRLGRRVVPRLTAAHPRGKGLPAYRFLAAVQDQDGALVMWKWAGLLAAPFLPRVRVGRVILARASWLLGDDDVAALRGALGSDVAAFDAVRALAARRGLPRRLAVADWQRELFADLEDPLQATSLAAAVVARGGSRLVEAFPCGDDLLARGPGGRHASEIVLLALRDPAAARPLRPPVDRAAPAGRGARRHAPGSDWLLARLHAGAASLDDLLRGVVAPVAGELLDPRGTRWGFRRAAHADPHVALWVRGEPAWLLSEVAPALHAAGAPFMDGGALDRLQLDTHRRDADRHGGDEGADLVDRIEHLDSRAVLAALAAEDEAADPDARWHLALIGIEGMLGALGLDAAARARLYLELRDERAAARGAGPRLWRAVGARDRSSRDQIDAMLAPGAPPDDRLAAGRAALAARDERLAALSPRFAALLGDPLDPRAPAARLAAIDSIDAHVARWLPGAHAAHVLVLLDLLRRHHRRALAR